MCSLSRSTSTCPGISRSPVNSANAILHQRGGSWLLAANPRVDLHAARQVYVAVNLALGTRHLQGHGVVDPVAHGVARQGAVGDGGRERERSGIELRQVEVEIHRKDVARLHRRKL